MPILISGRSLYVNAGWLAELSTFFAKTFFGNSPVNELQLSPDISYEDILELMRVVFYCPTRKPITVANVTTVMHLANQFCMKPVIDRCEDIIARRNFHFFFNLKVLSQCGRNSPTMSLIVDKLSKLPEDELSTLQFSQMPGDIVADVYAAKIKRNKFKNDRCCFIKHNQENVSNLEVTPICSLADNSFNR
uniref:BTB domain-containing protein n=1 Tax=Syphacia muris TaxID=451379 RepID=A0A0N5AGK1_9BILA